MSGSVSPDVCNSVCLSIFVTLMHIWKEKKFYEMVQRLLLEGKESYGMNCFEVCMVEQNCNN